MDTRTLVDVLTLVLTVSGSYLFSVHRLENRIRGLEIKIAILLDRDRQRRLKDYQAVPQSDSDSEDAVTV